MAYFGSDLKKFNQLYRECDEIYHKIAIKNKMSDSMFVILYAIANLGEECCQKDIVRYFYLSKQTINSSVKKLEKENYLQLSESKGRDMKISLTPKGQKLVDEKIVPIINIDNAIFKELGKKDSEELLRITQKYIDILKRKVKDTYER